MPGQKGFSQNWAPFREDYTLIALVSAGKLLPAEPWDRERSLETLASLSKDTEPSTGAWGPVVIFHSSWLNTGLPFGSLWSGQEEGPRGPMDSITSVLGQKKTTRQASEQPGAGWLQITGACGSKSLLILSLALATFFHLTSLFKQEKSGRLMVRK